MLRIYITGCGRSGTTILQHLFDAFENIEIIYSEIAWTVLVNKQNTVTKRLFNVGGDGLGIYWNPEVFNQLNDFEISVLHIIRHPFDVLTSKLRNIERFISLETYLNVFNTIPLEKKILNDYFLIRFEDMVTFPDKTQKILAEKYNLNIKYKWSEYPLDPEEERKKNPRWPAMKKVRPLSPSVVGRWERKEKDVKYIQELVDNNPELLDICEKYWSDISINRIKLRS